MQKANFILSCPSIQIGLNYLIKGYKIPLCCTYINECLHLNGGDREGTLLETFLEDDKVQYQKREDLWKNPSDCCLRKVMCAMAFSPLEGSRPLPETEYHSNCNSGFALQLLCCFLITKSLYSYIEVSQHKET